MLLSMTGYGAARHQGESLVLGIELRSVNNRYLKVSVRGSEPYNLLEPEFEKVVRQTVRRGTVQVHVRAERQYQPQEFQLNAVALASYVEQARRAAREANVPEESLLGQVLALPGVAPEPGAAGFNHEEQWPVVEHVLRAALANLQVMRQEEGRAMTQELLQHRDALALHLDRVRRRAPEVAAAHRDRLHERVRKLLGELDVELDQRDLIKEVAIFAERSDIAEEVVRLDSHLEQFREVMNESESPGRKLEFLVQEMSRESNTIGSKASDVEISRQVVEIKSILEKIRELIQNVE